MPDRPKNREVENEDLRPAGDGRPPRPATEPKGARAQKDSPTRTDPGSGEPRGEGRRP
ncbi:hypothetical protein [Caulobacter sp. 17J65-9]|uniref:hypothetical protein n=1 Tax=Caulobacter sp. 17J65-9 TaxID=2709382 RepID=UPI0013D73F80|nr:hypothetical protein [Caulobacter sp. 17J65-9]